MCVLSSLKAFPVQTTATRGTRGNQTNELLFMETCKSRKITTIVFISFKDFDFHREHVFHCCCGRKNCEEQLELLFRQQYQHNAQKEHIWSFWSGECIFLKVGNRSISASNFSQWLNILKQSQLEAAWPKFMNRKQDNHGFGGLRPPRPALLLYYPRGEPAKGPAGRRSGILRGGVVGRGRGLRWGGTGRGVVACCSRVLWVVKEVLK